MITKIVGWFIRITIHEYIFMVQFDYDANIFLVLRKFEGCEETIA